MANEVHADHESGDSLYGVVYNSAGQANIAGGNTFEDWGDGASDADTYDFAITEVGTGGVRYVGDFPSTITTAGIYSVVSFLKLGASPADGDDIIGGQTIYWSGTAELTETQYSMNVAIPGSPTANSINERIAAVDDLTQASGDGDLAALASICTEARLAELDAANLPSDVDAILTDTGTTLENRAIAIETDTADIQSQIGTAGAGLSDLGGMSTGMKAEVNAEVDTALNTAIPGSPTADSINERIAAIDNLTQASGAGDLAATKVKTDGLNFTGTDVKATLDGEETVTNSASRTASKADVSALALASICTEARLAELDAAKLPTDIDFIKNVQEGDVSIDTSATPWQAVVKIKGTDTELIRKDLADKDGNNIASVNALIGRYTEPS